MAKNIEPKLKKIGDYLKLDEDTVFTIPEYQRAYSWGIENCDKLWQDINDFVESESKDRYFFGTIIINCQDNDTKYGLIDGQQRTTTFLLLLKALLVRINIAIGRTSNDDDSASLRRGLQERRRRIMGILYKAETEDISDTPNSEIDAEICHRAIMPHSGSNLQEIRTDAEIGSEAEFAGVVNKLGNKILLEERINRAIGNEWFRTKVSTKLENKTGYIDSKYPLACALVAQYQNKNKPYWKKDDIMTATDKASKRILQFIFAQ